MSLLKHFTSTRNFYSAAASGWAGWALAHPEFESSVNPILTRGADYAHHSTTSPPGFSDLATALSERPKPLLWCRSDTETNTPYFFKTFFF